MSLIEGDKECRGLPNWEVLDIPNLLPPNLPQVSNLREVKHADREAQ